ncbi:MAG: pitrilysin family protein [Minisyncoccia bacterium]
MNYTKKVLSNGLRIVVVPMKENPTVTVLVLVEAGSKYEQKENNGISHFLEHMCFKGTQKRLTHKEISFELDELGAHYNAFTGQEYTGYFAKADNASFEKILDVVSDIYQNSTFSEKEMEKEKGVILEEINMYKDLPQRIVEEEFSKLLYGDVPAGWSIAGLKENILKMKRSDFVDYRKKHYVAEATTVVVAGNVEEKKAFDMVKKSFSKISVSKKYGKKGVKETQKKPQVGLYFKDTDQTHIILGVRSLDMYKDNISVARLLSGILGGGMSSRLFTKMREDLGICYYVHAGQDSSTDHGVFVVSAGVDTKRIGIAIKAIIEEFARLKEELVSKEELDKVKSMLIGNLKLSLESSDSIAEFYGFQEAFKKKIGNPEDRIKEIKAVTAEEIRKLANEIFVDKKLNLSIVGKFKDKTMFEKILKF